MPKIILIVMHYHMFIFCPYILKAKKFAEPLFQSKKIAEKVRNFWAIL